MKGAKKKNVFFTPFPYPLINVIPQFVHRQTRAGGPTLQTDSMTGVFEPFNYIFIGVDQIFYF